MRPTATYSFAGGLCISQAWAWGVPFVEGWGVGGPCGNSPMTIHPQACAACLTSQRRPSLRWPLPRCAQGPTVLVGLGQAWALSTGMPLSRQDEPGIAACGWAWPELCMLHRKQKASYAHEDFTGEAHPLRASAHAQVRSDLLAFGSAEGDLWFAVLGAPEEDPSPTTSAPAAAPGSQGAAAGASAAPAGADKGSAPVWTNPQLRKASAMGCALHSLAVTCMVWLREHRLDSCHKLAASHCGLCFAGLAAHPPCAHHVPGLVI